MIRMFTDWQNKIKPNNDFTCQDCKKKITDKKPRAFIGDKFSTYYLCNKCYSKHKDKSMLETLQPLINYIKTNLIKPKYTDEEILKIAYDIFNIFDELYTIY